MREGDLPQKRRGVVATENAENSKRGGRWMEGVTAVGIAVDKGVAAAAAQLIEGMG